MSITLLLSGLCISLILTTALPPSNNTNYPRLQVKDKLPKWWPQPDSVAKGGSVFNSEYYQTQANRLIRAIVDNRLGGKDITEEDIIQGTKSLYLCSDIVKMVSNFVMKK